MIDTRTVNYGDGRLEVARLINDRNIDQWDRRDPLAFESSIIWTRDISALDFVRVATVRNARSRRGALRLDDSRLTVVGYSKLTDDAPTDPKTHHYTRRVFYLRDEDSRLNMNAFPRGAIDPSSLSPGAKGLSPQASESGYPYYLRREEDAR